MSAPKKSKRAYLYKQLADTLRKDILSGVYHPDERLPSMDDLSAQYSMNRITVKRALSELRAEDLIYSIPAQGTYVSKKESNILPQSTNGRKTIGLVLSGIDPHAYGSYHVDIVTGIQEGLSDIEWYLMLVTLSEASEDRAYEHVMQIQLDGAIYLGIFEPSLLRRLVKNGPPSVLVDQNMRGLKSDVINVDNYGGAFEATSHLISLGHQSLACVTGFPGHITDERMSGVKDAWKEHGLPETSLQWFEGNFQRESGCEAASKILKKNQRPTAIFCFNDEMAAGALQTLLGSGEVKVPDDISVMGFDNINWAVATYPQLSTVNVERFAMGRLAVQRLQDTLTNPNHTTTSTSVRTQMTERASTSSPKT
ncbi:GntR family transcriptional regulator [Kiritimatiellota bacterium B12222]|nr:GntR family transcriptional regulator [Kiritimatiellota bacterium B12222]